MTHITFVILVFSGALFDLLPFGVPIQKMAIILYMMINIIVRGNNKFPVDAIKLIYPYLLYLCYAFISAYSVSGSFLYVASALQPLCIGVVFYIYLLSCHINNFKLKDLYHTLLLIVITQIVFAFIKLLTHGIDEKVLIGSMSNVAGQIGFLFPAIAVPLIFFFMKNKSQFYFFMIIIGLFSFGIINEKRSVVFLMPLIVWGSIQANSQILIKSYQIVNCLKLLFIIIFILLSVVIGASFIPSLNIDNRYGGSVNLVQLVQYAYDYLTMDYGDSLQGSYADAGLNQNIQVGRITLLLSIVQWISNSNWFVMLFGIGFGVATPSDWLGGNVDPLFSILGTRGAISGACLSLIETGIFGFGLFVLFFNKIHNRIWYLIKDAGDHHLKRWYKMVAVAFYIFVYDFFFYSTTLFRVLPMPVIFFAIIFTLVKQKKADQISSI